MVRIFDLPPGGLVDGSAAQEVDAQGKPINKNEKSVVEEFKQDLTRKDAINAQNRQREIFKKKPKDSDVQSVVTVTEKEEKDPYRKGFQTPTEDNPSGSNAGGMKVSIRPKLAVNVMRVEFPLDIINELNQHIDDVFIPATDDDSIFGTVGKDHSGGLVGQIRRNERSAQTTFPHEGDEVGEQFSSVLLRLGKEYMKYTVGDIECKTEIQSMWTIHSYEGDYNPVHDHGTKTQMGLSCILYLKVPPQIEALGNPSEVFEGLNHSSGAIDGFTYLVWGTNGIRDINVLRPITEEYIKPEVGTLIMFPAWLRHGVMPFFGEGERRTFSANINVTPERKITGSHYRKDHQYGLMGP